MENEKRARFPLIFSSEQAVCHALEFVGLTLRVLNQISWSPTFNLHCEWWTK